ncbi:Com family DNA-binding transcriptional regulator [Candidatus Uhrbacteria bacterium]|nr:Com family DNA-binding transcriptional regulator [Candidatus Uhrbacteria bacterium]
MPSIQSATHYRYNEYRCKECSKLMFKGLLVDSEIEVKCRRCGAVNLYQGVSSTRYLCLIADTCPNKVAAKQKISP